MDSQRTRKTRPETLRNAGVVAVICAIVFLGASIYDCRHPVERFQNATVVALQRVPRNQRLRDIGGKPYGVPNLDACRVIVREDSGREEAWMITEREFRNLHEGERVLVHYRTGRILAGPHDVSVKPLLQ